MLRLYDSRLSGNAWKVRILLTQLGLLEAAFEGLSMAVTFLRVAAAFQVLDGLQVVAALSLRGLKDARAPMWIALGSYLLAGFPVCILFGFGLHMKGLGIWIGLAFGLFVAAITMCWRFWYLSKDR